MENKKKIKRTGGGIPLIATVALILSAVGAMIYAFLQFVWPSIYSPFATISAVLMYFLAFVPVIGWILIAVICSIILLINFVITWVLNVGFTIAVIAGLTLGITSLLTAVKQTGKGRVLSWMAIIISGLVLLTSFCLSLANLITMIISVFVVMIILSVVFVIFALLPLIFV